MFITLNVPFHKSWIILPYLIFYKILNFNFKSLDKDVWDTVDFIVDITPELFALKIHPCVNIAETSLPHTLVFRPIANNTVFFLIINFLGKVILHHEYISYLTIFS